MSLVELDGVLADGVPADGVPWWLDGPNVWGDRLGDGFADVVEAASGLADALLDRRLRVLDERGRRLEAERVVLLAEAERRKSYRGDHHPSIHGWLRSSVVWSRAECNDRTQLARLVEAYREVGEYLWEGWLSVANAVQVARVFANPRTRDAFDAALGVLLNQAARREHDDLREWLTDWVAAADVDGAHRDREASHHGRHASLTEFAGVGTLFAQWGDLDTAINQEIFDQFVQAEWDADWALTVAEHGDQACVAVMPRSDAQRRADAVSAIFRRAASTPPGGKGPRFVVNLHIDFVTWCELMTRQQLFPDHHDASLVSGERLPTQIRCATSDGRTLDPIAVLRASLEHWVRFVILDDDGVPIRMGRTRRLFAGAGRQAVMMLSTRCTHPGCRIRSTHCEADHLIEWSNGGHTDPDNGNPRCPRHNRARNTGLRATRDYYGWHTYRPDGTEIS